MATLLFVTELYFLKRVILFQGVQFIPQGQGYRWILHFLNDYDVQLQQSKCKKSVRENSNLIECNDIAKFLDSCWTPHLWKMKP